MMSHAVMMRVTL